MKMMRYNCHVYVMLCGKSDFEDVIKILNQLTLSSPEKGDPGWV